MDFAGPVGGDGAAANGVDDEVVERSVNGVVGGGNQVAVDVLGGDDEGVGADRGEGGGNEEIGPRVGGRGGKVMASAIGREEDLVDTHIVDGLAGDAERISGERGTGAGEGDGWRIGIGEAGDGDIGDGAAAEVGGGELIEARLPGGHVGDSVGGIGSASEGVGSIEVPLEADGASTRWR